MRSSNILDIYSKDLLGSTHLPLYSPTPCQLSECAYISEGRLLQPQPEEEPHRGEKVQANPLTTSYVRLLYSSRPL